MSKKLKDSVIIAEDQGDDLVDKTLRPLSLDEFIGQNHIKENLHIFIKAAKERNDVLDHVLLYGPPGLGKTTIAQIIAKEMEVSFKATSAPMLTKAGDLAAIITNLQQGDVLFIDEIHRLSTHVEEILYSAMEDYKLDLIIGEGPAARSIRIDVPAFTLVGATTRLGLLSNPLIDRFGIPLRLDFYSSQDLCIVIKRAANLLFSHIDDSGAEEIARRARGTPRIALRLLRRVRDFAAVAEDQIINQKIADYALNKLGVDRFGLDSNDQRYLRFIADNYAGGPVGIETIAAGLSEQRDSIEETIEPYLIQKGFMQRTARGRVLTDSAFAHIGAKPINL